MMELGRRGVWAGKGKKKRGRGDWRRRGKRGLEGRRGGKGDGVGVGGGGGGGWGGGGGVAVSQGG